MIKRSVQQRKRQILRNFTGNFFMTLTHYFFHLNQNVTTDYHQFTHILGQKILTERGWIKISSAEEDANPSQFYRLFFMRSTHNISFI